MPEPSKRERLLAAIKARLQAIRTYDDEGRFATDAGAAVFINELPGLGPSDPDEAIVVVVNQDSVTHVGEHTRAIIPIEMQATVRVDRLEEPYQAAERILADIKRAMELEDRTFGRLCAPRMERQSTRIVPQQEGSAFVGVGVTYWFPVNEAWGNP